MYNTELIVCHPEVTCPPLEDFRIYFLNLTILPVIKMLKQVQHDKKIFYKSSCLGIT